MLASIDDRINTAKVLLIVNNSSALSSQVADYYQSARGLGAHRLGFAFTSQTSIPDAEAYAIRDTVGNYININSIEAVISSAHVPHSYTGKAFNNLLGLAHRSIGMMKGTVSANSLEYAVAHAYCNKLDAWLDANFNNLANPIGSLFSYSDWAIKSNSWKVAAQFIPYGRLGFAKYHSYYPDESFIVCKRIIDDAIAAENAGGFFADKTKPVHYCYNTAGYLDTFPFTELARRRVVTEGGGNSKIIGWSYPVGFTGLPTISYWLSDYDNSTIAAQHKALWGHVGFARNLYGASAVDGSVFNAHANTYTCLPGSWHVGGASFGVSEFGTRLLLDGACAATGTVNEPYSGSLHNVDIFMQQLIAGYSMAEAALFSNTEAFWQQDNWGDPLYRPFPRFGLADGQLLSITDLTSARSGVLTPPPTRAMTNLDKQRTMSNITPNRGATWHG